MMTAGGTAMVRERAACCASMVRGDCVRNCSYCNEGCCIISTCLSCVLARHPFPDGGWPSMTHLLSKRRPTGGFGGTKKLSRWEIQAIFMFPEDS